MAEVPINRSLPSGYDEDFVHPVDEDFQCTICQLPSKEPIQTRCGHRFCKECIEEHFVRKEQQGQYCSCPVDREVLLRDKDVFPDKITERKILSLVTRCCSKGCEWTGELRAKEKHLESCPFKVIRCTYENCEVTVAKKDLQKHVTEQCTWRITPCDFCQEPYAECQMEDHHETCIRFVITCVCGALTSREMIQNHTETYCPKTKIPCPYAAMGCKTKVPREKLETHLQSTTENHIKLVQEELTKRTRDLNGLKEQVNILQNKNVERCEALQEEMNALKKQDETEVQILKEDLQNVRTANEEQGSDLRRQLEEKVNILHKGNEERCETLQNEVNILRRQHEKEIQILQEEFEKKIKTLQNKHAAFEEKVNILEAQLQREVNTIRNERAAYEDDQRRQLEEKLNLMAWYTNVKISVAAGLLSLVFFAVFKAK